MMITPNSRQKEREEKRRFWKQHIENWETTNLTQAKYCRKHHLSVHRFIYWKKKFQLVEPAQSLIELKLPPASYTEPSPASTLRVAVNRFQVAVDRDFDPLTLRQLVYTLESM